MSREKWNGLWFHVCSPTVPACSRPSAWPEICAWLNASRPGSKNWVLGTLSSYSPLRFLGSSWPSAWKPWKANLLHILSTLKTVTSLRLLWCVNVPIQACSVGFVWVLVFLFWMLVFLFFGILDIVMLLLLLVLLGSEGACLDRGRQHLWVKWFKKIWACSLWTSSRQSLLEGENLFFLQLNLNYLRIHRFTLVLDWLAKHKGTHLCWFSSGIVKRMPLNLWVVWFGEKCMMWSFNRSSNSNEVVVKTCKRWDTHKWLLLPFSQGRLKICILLVVLKSDGCEQWTVFWYFYFVLHERILRFLIFDHFLSLDMAT